MTNYSWLLAFTETVFWFPASGTTRDPLILLSSLIAIVSLPDNSNEDFKFHGWPELTYATKEARSRCSMQDTSSDWLLYREGSPNRSIWDLLIHRSYISFLLSAVDYFSNQVWYDMETSTIIYHSILWLDSHQSLDEKLRSASANYSSFNNLLNKRKTPSSTTMLISDCINDNKGFYAFRGHQQSSNFGILSKAKQSCVAFPFSSRILHQLVS